MFVVGELRDYFEFFSNIVEDDADNYLVLFVNIEESKCHLDEEILFSTNDVARYIDLEGEKFAQLIVVR